jgi:hypothetical protein
VEPDLCSQLGVLLVYAMWQCMDLCYAPAVQLVVAAGLISNRVFFVVEYFSVVIFLSTPLSRHYSKV